MKGRYLTIRVPVTAALLRDAEVVKEIIRVVQRRVGAMVEEYEHRQREKAALN